MAASRKCRQHTQSKIDAVARCARIENHNIMIYIQNSASTHPISVPDNLTDTSDVKHADTSISRNPALWVRQQQAIVFMPAVRRHFDRFDRTLQPVHNTLNRHNGLAAWHDRFRVSWPPFAAPRIAGVFLPRDYHRTDDDYRYAGAFRTRRPRFCYNRN